MSSAVSNQHCGITPPPQNMNENSWPSAFVVDNNETEF